MNERVAHAVLLFCRALRSRRFLRQESLLAQKLTSEATMAALIDEYSLTAVPLEMRFGETRLSTGAGFIWNNQNQLFLITNWHNVTGINPHRRASVKKCERAGRDRHAIA